MLILHLRIVNVISAVQQKVISSVSANYMTVTSNCYMVRTQICCDVVTKLRCGGDVKGEGNDLDRCQLDNCV